MFSFALLTSIRTGSIFKPAPRIEGTWRSADMNPIVRMVAKGTGDYLPDGTALHRPDKRSRDHLHLR